MNEKKLSRQQNSILNSSVIVVSRIIQLFLTFVVRTVLIRYFGVSVLGLDGLFSSILSVLSLADLGLNTAVIYSLYKPLADNNKEKTSAYISLLQRLYTIIGSVVFILGIALIPVLPFIINLPENLPHIYLYYILSILNTTISYYLSSRRIIFEADQKLRTVTIVDMTTNICLQISQVIIIILWAEYGWVLLSRIIGTILSNLIIFSLGNKDYPFLAKYRNEKLSLKEKKMLIKNTGAIVCHKVGTVFVTGTDQLIISTFISTVQSGLYSNYLTIFNGVMYFITYSINSLIPSIGNLKAETDNIEHQYSIFEMVFCINFIMSSFSTIMLFCLVNPFINLWLGTEYSLNQTVVAVLCINFYISTMRFGVGAFTTAAGLFKETLIKPIAESMINVVVSIILVKSVGLLGVFLGTTASLVFGSVWVDPVILYRKWFNRSSYKYFIEYIALFGITSMASLGVSHLCTIIFHTMTIMSFFGRTIFGIICASAFSILVSSTLPGFKPLLSRLVKKQ